MINRRNFLGGVFALAASVPLAKISRATATIYCNGTDCDADGLYALFRGDPVNILADDLNIHRAKTGLLVNGGRFFLRKPLLIEDAAHALMRDSRFICSFRDSARVLLINSMDVRLVDLEFTDENLVRPPIEQDDLCKVTVSFMDDALCQKHRRRG